jgi:hypothetical protein
MKPGRDFLRINSAVDDLNACPSNPQFICLSGFGGRDENRL